jgi:hypothetical protein
VPRLGIQRGEARRKANHSICAGVLAIKVFRQSETADERRFKSTYRRKYQKNAFLLCVFLDETRRKSTESMRAEGSASKEL